ncbi:MAG: hypothetical protein COW79_11405 [Bdellovibrionales bacterium CG22_combo_CG10-13_8_21_14_all_38_13]|nr:MAG: hypothetical protein COW79_11405 [Bdellovibrionales bacterium CG22_combo_CG10-13_8_21_14_all_38_13]
MAILLLLVSCSTTDLQPPVFMVSEEASQQTVQDNQVKTIQAKSTRRRQSQTTNSIDANESDEALTQKEPLTTEVKLATITTDYTERTYDLILSLDENKQVTAIKTKSNKGKVKNYPVHVLNKQIVLVKAVGVSLVTLLCRDFNQTSGCAIEIEYPSNLTYGKFLRFESNLVYQNDQWQLQSQNRQFTSMHLVAKKVFGILIGVERIELR